MTESVIVYRSRAEQIVDNAIYDNPGIFLFVIVSSVIALTFYQFLVSKTKRNGFLRKYAAFIAFIFWIVLGVIAHNFQMM